VIAAIVGIAAASFELFAQMAPYLLLGVLVAGLLHVLLPVGAVSRHLGRPGPGSVLKAAVIGIPLPICSCGVVPVAASLKKEGASDGATVSFMVTTPTTGVDSILATYSLLGLPIAIARVAAAFVLGTVAGLLTSLTERGPGQAGAATRESGAAREERRGGANRLAGAARYAFDELFGGIARPLLIGTLLGGAVAWFLPDGVLAEYVGEGFLSYLVMMAAGVPLYVCASGSIPLAAALLAKGLSPGAALVFLVAGPATNLATVTVISQMLGKRVLAIYLGVLAVGSIAAGAATDALMGLPGAWLPASGSAGSHIHEGLSALEIASGAALGALVLFHAVKGTIRGLRREGSPGAGAIVIEVPDMSCGHCARTITEALSGMAGVTAVRADPATRLVSVDVDGRADAGLIAEAIEAAGFHPRRSAPPCGCGSCG